MDRQCATCGKKFSRATTMRRHALYHTAPDEGKKYECHTCGKTFKRADRLSRHMRIHTGHDLKDCKHCGRGFRPDYLLLHQKSCRGRFEHDPNSAYVSEQRESRAIKEWCPSVVQQVNPQPRLEHLRLVKPMQFVNENASSIWNVDREVRRAWRTNSIRSADGAVTSAMDVLVEAKHLVRSDDLLGLKGLMSSLEPQWAKITTFLQLSVEAARWRDDNELGDDSAWQDDSAWGMSLLEHAADSGAFEVLRYLLSPWSNLKDAPRSRSVLHRTVQHGYLGMVTFLVRDKNANLHLLSESELTDLSPLAVAIKSGKVDTVKHLIDLGCNLQAKCDSDLNTAVSIALRARRQGIAQWLIDHGASVTKVSRIGRSPLHYAAELGALNIMQALLRLGAEIDVGVKPYLETPLCSAAWYGQADAMLLLLNSGAKVGGIAERSEGTPLYAVCSGVQRDGLSAFDLLVARGVDLDRMYENRGQMCTVLGSICRNPWGQPAGVKCLVDAGADINLGDRAPILNAWEFGTAEVFKILLRSGAEYESLHLEEVPVVDSLWGPGRREEKLLILRAWEEEQVHSSSFTG